MMLLSWFRRPRTRRALSVDPDVEREKRALLAKLAQSVIEFEHSRDGIHELATATMKIMKQQGKKR
ncbi:hypothetical protein [Rhizobium sp. Nf11,1]|uniref:hypothetical protein n=1 Tax=Rhizobium sp. Nf11,1 TaxID=3404923 RepID=UPI003D346AC0